MDGERMHAAAEAQPVNATGSAPADATLYVLPGSNAA
jgi:hypothetical protein